MERIRTIITGLLLTMTFLSSAQVSPVPIDTAYSFIRVDADTLYWGHDSTNLVNFYQKLANVCNTKQGHVNILHIGGSHVQAGTLSHRLRTHLLSAYGEEPADRGIVFPYSAAPACNNPHDYKVSRSKPFKLTRNVYQNHFTPLGVTGIAVSCFDTLTTLSIKMNDPQFDFEADTIILLGHTKGWAIDPIIKDDTLVHFPDSEDLENGRYYFYLNHLSDNYTFYFPCSKGDTFSVDGILLKNGRPGITFHSIGVNGAAVPDYLQCENFERDLSLLQPDLVIFGIGVNDAFGPGFDSVQFKENYLKLIHKIQKVNPHCAFIFMTNNDTFHSGRRGHYTVNPTGPEVCDVMYRLANLTGSAVWNQFAIMGGLASMEKWCQHGLAQYDRVHFTTEGYNLIGDLFYNAFIQPLQDDF